MRPAKVLAIARRTARSCGLTVAEIPGRGKGSHRIFVVLDGNGSQVGRFGLTGHSRESSWTVLRGVEDALSHLFGEKRLEE